MSRLEHEVAVYTAAFAPPPFSLCGGIGQRNRAGSASAPGSWDAVSAHGAPVRRACQCSMVGHADNKVLIISLRLALLLGRCSGSISGTKTKPRVRSWPTRDTFLPSTSRRLSGRESLLETRDVARASTSLAQADGRGGSASPAQDHLSL